MDVRVGVWLLTAGLAAAAVHAGEPLDSRVAEVLKTGPYRDGHWGILVVDGSSGATVFERNADRMFCPASVTKLFSTAAALVDLGADYRFQTPIVRRGDVDKNGTLRGDLILIAQGDPCLGGRTGPEGSLLFRDVDHTYSDNNPDAAIVASDPLGGLDQMAREIRAAGIKAVKGDVLVDDRLFDRVESSGSGPSRVSPIVINDNVIDVIAMPSGKPGEPATVRLVPETAFVTMDARVDTVEAGEPARLEVRSVGPRRFTARGQIPVGHRPVVKFYEVEEPAAFARTLLIETLRRRGIDVGAAAIGDNAPEDPPAWAEVAKLPKAAEYTSPPFREYARVILKVSHNLHASTLPMLLAAHHGERTLHAGMAREAVILRDLGVPGRSISFGGGAGGTRSDLATPRATVALLRAMSARSDFRAYEGALPVLGRDGSLSKAVSPESPARGHVRAKTGTFVVVNSLDGKAVLASKALAGYLETASGRSLVFAFFVNGVPLDVSGANIPGAVSQAGRLLGTLCEVFYGSADASIAPGDSPKAER
jgi:D-alanyl-D-alanine carboxypeptidase/D-alanyl-D-alanine-endopeptidase (penicillin-binding protein 4)